MKILTGISRLLVGLLFIFSGFIKANDPIGFSYKLTEYYSIFGTHFLQHQEVLQAIFICVAEIVLGVCVLIGIRMRITTWLLLAMIVFFIFLTGFTAFGNWFFEHPDHPRTLWWANLLGFTPQNIYYMKDCGCFGDAIKLTPWESFTKDLVLLILIVILFIRRNHIKPFFAKIMQTNLIIFFTLLSTAFSVYCWMYMPYINYLKWDEGADITELTKEIPDTKDYFYLYKNKQTGVVEGFPLSDLPTTINETHTYVDRKDSIIKKGVPAAIHDFWLRTPEGEDITKTVLEENTYKLFVVAYDLNKTRIRPIKKLKETAVEWQAAGYKMYALTGSDPKDLENFRHEHQLAFPFFQLDPTGLKAVIRSNPGYLLLHKGVVVKRWSSRETPTMKDLEKAMRKYEKKSGS